ncbi:MAG: rlx protein, partial [Lachnospiraceae bacterium]|nr:rlx protein [Lachnospiraceae bacterium]
KENLDDTVPSLKGLKAERSKLLIMKDAQYDTYRFFQEYQKELRTVCTNVDAILGKGRSSDRKKTRETEIT